MSTYELLGPAVLRTPYVLLAASGCGGAPALLLFGAVSLGPLAGVSLFFVLWYCYRIIVYRYRDRITEIVSVRYYRIVIERYYRSFRYDIQFQ